MTEEELRAAPIVARVRRPGDVAGATRSTAQKYAAAAATLAARVAPGKSAIHGWGAYAARAHAKGECDSVFIGVVHFAFIIRRRRRMLAL
jgi:hypothetical protein